MINTHTHTHTHTIESNYFTILKEAAELVGIKLFKNEKLEWKKLVEIFDIRNGYTPSKSKKEFWQDGTIPWYRMEDIRKNGKILSNASQYITEKSIKGKGVFKAGSIILATTATIGEHALLTVDSLANQRFTNFKINEEHKIKLYEKYVFYYFDIIDEWCKKNIKISNFPAVDMDKLYNFEIPIPSLKVQNHIVSILDKFDMLVNNISEGLPKEIEQRQKQYEYYREKLLNFNKNN